MPSWGEISSAPIRPPWKPTKPTATIHGSSETGARKITVSASGATASASHSVHDAGSRGPAAGAGPNAASPKRPPIATRLIIEAVDEGLDAPIDKAIDVEVRAFLKTLKTEDASEGIQAFFGKREPSFKGK